MSFLPFFPISLAPLDVSRALLNPDLLPVTNLPLFKSTMPFYYPPSLLDPHSALDVFFFPASRILMFDGYCDCGCNSNNKNYIVILFINKYIVTVSKHLDIHELLFNHRIIVESKLKYKVVPIDSLEYKEKLQVSDFNISEIRFRDGNVRVWSRDGFNTYDIIEAYGHIVNRLVDKIVIIYDEVLCKPLVKPLDYIPDQSKNEYDVNPTSIQTFKTPQWCRWLEGNHIELSKSTDINTLLSALILGHERQSRNSLIYIDDFAQVFEDLIFIGQGPLF